jgi:hypothetical protein
MRASFVDLKNLPILMTCPVFSDHCQLETLDGTVRQRVGVRRPILPQRPGLLPYEVLGLPAVLQTHSASDSRKRRWRKAIPATRLISPSCSTNFVPRASLRTPFTAIYGDGV